MNQNLRVVLAVTASAVIGATIGSHRVVASDHDDGSQATADKSVNLTDLLVYNEKDQNSSITTNDLIFQMNVNPRTPAKTDAFFNTNARYEFHMTRVGRADKNGTTPTGAEDAVLRFEFAKPDANKQQLITVTWIGDGETVSGAAGNTTPFAKSAAPNVNSITLGGKNMTVFAGVREDTFFFDVEQFLKVRDTAMQRAAGNTSVAQATFRKPGVDFTKGLNVLSIVARVPRELIAGSSGATTFDVWETTSVKQ